MSDNQTSTIIYRVNPNKAVIIACLLELHLWDAMSPGEREAICERGEVWDTQAGREFAEIMEAA